MRYALLLCVGLIGVMPWRVAAQDEYAIQGQVLDAETETPLVGAHIFLANSTQGTVTDSDGQFVLDRLAQGTHEIAISMLGFTLEVVRMTFPGDEETPHLFRLTPRVLPMGEVVIAAARSEREARNWERYIDAFIVHFIGETDNADQVTLLNPEVLYFTASAPGHLEAAATEPLVIENRALGYRLFYHLKELAATDTGVRYYGTTRFEELAPRNRRERRRWQRNRRQTYEGSVRHFIAALSETRDRRDIRRVGFTVGLAPRFKVNPMYTIPVHEEELLQPAGETHRYFLSFPDYLQVIYEPDMPRAPSSGIPGASRVVSTETYTSWITLNDGPAEVDAFGHFTAPYAVTTYGLWGQSRVADALPRNYRPD